jgi:tetratricopeptide (TPR) repeat protein
VGGGSYIDRAEGRLRDAFERMREAAQFAEVNGFRATALTWTLGEVSTLLIIAADTAGARRRLRDILASGAFDDLPPAGRPWNTVMSAFIELGMLSEARTMLARWEAELPDTLRAPTNAVDYRRHARQLPILESGDLDAISRGYRQAQVEERCTRCFRWPLAEVEARRGNVAEAIALYENSVEEPISVRFYPMQRVIALERLGPLYEEIGEFQKAAAVYAEFAEAWKEADPELQPRVRVALERVQLLLAEGANR